MTMEQGRTARESEGRKEDLSLNVYLDLEEMVVQEDVQNYLMKHGFDVIPKDPDRASESASPDVFITNLKEWEKKELSNTMEKCSRSDMIPLLLVNSMKAPHLDSIPDGMSFRFLRIPFQNEELLLELENIKKELRSKKEIERLNKKVHEQSLNIQELESTKDHLVTATWREREIKQKLEETLEELKQTKVLVDKKNKEITESINYAKRIQNAIIPEEKEFEEALPDHFIFYQPRDVVSGDFPWMYRKGNETYLAAVDCTGHGVPGAMMSLIGFLLLNDIVNDPGSHSPAEVLQKLHYTLVRILKQDHEANDCADGMDLGLMKIDKEEGTVTYAGAHRPLYMLREGEVHQYKGDKFPIGGTQYRRKHEYHDQVIPYQEGDRMYVFSDGLPDQFGGDGNFKFGNKRIRELIKKHADKSLKEQEELFVRSFERWKKDQRQLDDVLLIGLGF
jgi:serine phosphatase RsbU (regulator of sigma subunit)